jgi:hypothetical protein
MEGKYQCEKLELVLTVWAWVSWSPLLLNYIDFKSLILDSNFKQLFLFLFIFYPFVSYYRAINSFIIFNVRYIVKKYRLHKTTKSLCPVSSYSVAQNFTYMKILLTVIRFANCVQMYS